MPEGFLATVNRFRDKLNRCRKYIHYQIDPAAWEKEGLSRTNWLLTIFILIAVLTTVLETEVIIREAIPRVFRYLNKLFIVVFSIEYFLRVWTVSESTKYSAKWGRLRYIFSFWSIIDLAAIIPFIFTLGLVDSLLLRIFRVFRIFSIVKLGKYSLALRNVINGITRRKYELMWSLIAALFIILLSATILYLTEGKANPEHFGSIPRALWWGAATLTKVGYGGANPSTILGKLFAVIFAVTAVGIIAVPTGILAGSFYEVLTKNNEQE
jgi:voltage-gated potassium channel